MISKHISLWAVLALSACTTAEPAAPADDAPVTEPGDSAAPAIDMTGPAGSPVDDAAATPPPHTCPTSGYGALIPSNSSCWTFLATDTGASSDGVNADVNEYALAPTTGARGYLVVFLNPSLGCPAQSIADPVTNIYNASTAVGDHVLAITYESDLVIGASCKNNDTCFTATRTAGVTGVNVTGEAPGFSIVQTAGIHERIALALTYLRASDAHGGWGQFLVAGADPNDPSGAAINWSKVIVMGHSQGGGYAAMVAKLHRVARMVALSSPCDVIDATGAIASWLVTGTWSTPIAQRGYGFGSIDDTTCTAHEAIWDAIGVPASGVQRDDQAVGCRGATPHTAPTQCTANMGEIGTLVTM